MKKSCIMLIAIFGLILLLPGLVFAGGKKEEPAAPAKAGSNVVKIALIIENTIDDKGWCQAMHDGIVDAQKQLPGRIQYSYSEKMLPVDAGSAARQYAAQGFSIIIGHGAQYKNLIMEMAGEFPNVTFAFGTSAETGPANVFTYMPESEETGYLNGVIAGLTTKTNNIGYVGPVDGGDAARYGRGFVLGIQSVNPAAKITVGHIGSFSDFVKSGELAHTQIRANADVLTGASQQAIGALRAVGDAQYASQNLWWVGQDLAQFGTPEGKAKCIAASSYDYAAVIVGFVQKLDAGIRGGQCIPMNFSNGGFIFKFNPDLPNMAPANVKAKVDEALAKFKATPNTLKWSDVDYSKL
ncbi:MAG: BMP family ABC transporter substrate-binding protein [Treponema sp.]|nr:BMP family ABC transporter substrate-binding protein [Treponema sp.]